jgi:hypothetical protein
LVNLSDGVAPPLRLTDICAVCQIIISPKSWTRP